MNFSDSVFLSRAIALAENGLYTASPNPRVGCVIVQDGRVIAEGWHQQAGGDHAEAAALRHCSGDLQNAEVFVSLEPCAHSGKTPSCAEALIRARPCRVVAAVADPNPLVCGKGMQMLNDAGIQASFAPPDSECARQAADLNIGFFSRMLRRRPWLRLKVAATLDGKSALASGLSRWISGEESRRDAHHLRARSCAIITGVGTALIDNPQLNIRHVSSPRQPLRVLIDRDLRVRPDLTMFADGSAMIATAQTPAQSAKDMFADKAEIVSYPNPDGKVDLGRLLAELASRGMNEVTVEAGRRLCGAFVAADLADEIVVYYAPKLFGGGLDMFDAPAPDTPDDAAKFVIAGCERMGDDVKVAYEKPGIRQDMATRAHEAAAKNI